MNRRGEPFLPPFLSLELRSLKNNKKVSLSGFGTFKGDRRKARKGRNPQTGHEVEIKERMVPKFKPAKALRDAVS